MSKNHNEMIKCPECQTEGDFKVWESINTSDAPELKELVRSSELFMWKCPKCGNDCIVFYPTYYHQPEDKVLIIDDFLAMGSALKGLISLIRDAGAEIIGAGIIIEKSYQQGGDLIRGMGVRVESLARIKSMDGNQIQFI